MKIAVRVCLKAGITLVGAGAIAIAPVQVAPPDVTVAADRPADARVVSDAKVEFLAAVRQMELPSAAVTAAPVPLNAASDLVVNAWNAVLPWIDYGVNLTDYVLGFIPYGYLIGDQISIVYYSLIRPVTNSFVVDLVAPVVDDPLNPASYVDGLFTLGSVTVTSLINLGINEFNYFFGWLIPPIPPLPLTTATDEMATAALATAAVSEEIATGGTAADPVVETATAETDSRAVETETEETVMQDPGESEDDTTTDTNPTTSSSGTVQAQGEVRDPGADASANEPTTESEIPSADNETADEQDETETTDTAEPESVDAGAAPDRDDAAQE